MDSCPKCSTDLQIPDLVECPACGVILAKAVPREMAERRRTTQRIRRHGAGVGAEGPATAVSVRQALVVGTILAVLIYAVPFTRFVLSYLAILVHELGHAAVGILFGYPSFPSFDFIYGGGVTLYFGRSSALLFVVGLGWIALVVALRRWRSWMFLTGGCGLLWLLLALTDLHDIALNASGHGAELLFGVFAYTKVFSGNVRVGAERWLYAMCGSFVVISAWVFALRLMESEEARVEYGAAKGGGHWMDMSRLSRNLELDLTQVAVLYWLASAAVPAVAYLAWLNRAKIVRWMAGSAVGSRLG